MLIALSNGMGVEAGIDPEAVSDDLIGRVLVLLMRDTISATAGPARRYSGRPNARGTSDVS